MTAEDAVILIGRKSEYILTYMSFVHLLEGWTLHIFCLGTFGFFYAAAAVSDFGPRSLERGGLGSVVW